MNLNALLEAMVKVEASDLHVKVGAPPTMRINRYLRSVDHPPVTAEQVNEVLEQVLPEHHRRIFETEGAADFAYTLPKVGRYRVAAFHQRGLIGLTFRRVSLVIPPLVDLNLPEAVGKLVHEHRGLILVTGITGSGKSTTLAAMLQEINNTRRYHVVTLEDPIEFVFEDKQCIINQLEVGVDCESFTKAMARVVRFDPDIIMIGEMRNRETVQAAVEAADTGHLVMSTLHTSDAKQTINRILHFFKKEEEEMVLEQLALNLRAIISQRLMSRSDIKGLIPAVELLINTPIVMKLVREGRIEDLQQAMKNRDEEMQSFDVSLALLVRDKKISLDEAVQYCADEPALRRMVRGEFSAGDQGALIGGGF